MHVSSHWVPCVDIRRYREYCARFFATAVTHAKKHKEAEEEEGARRPRVHIMVGFTIITQTLSWHNSRLRNRAFQTYKPFLYLNWIQTDQGSVYEQAHDTDEQTTIIGDTR